jgi:hypothetical protein
LFARKVLSRFFKVVARLPHQPVLGFGCGQHGAEGGTNGNPYSGKHQRLLTAKIKQSTAG